MKEVMKEKKNSYEFDVREGRTNKRGGGGAQRDLTRRQQGEAEGAPKETQHGGSK